jgi:hypothetical protein
MRITSGITDVVVFSANAGFAAKKLTDTFAWTAQHTWGNASSPLMVGNYLTDLNLDSMQARWQITGAYNIQWPIVCYGTGNTSHAGTIAFVKTRNATGGVHTTVNDNDELGGFHGYGSDGASYQGTVLVMGRVDGAVSSGNVPGSLEIWTSNTNSAGLTLRYTFGPLGQLKLGSGQDAGTAGQVLTSAGASAIPTWTAPPKELIVAASDETTALTTGTEKVTFRAPRAMTLTGIKASLSTSGSTTTTVDVHLNGTTIMSTNKLNFDASEKTTVTYSGAAAALTTTAVAADDEFTIDIDAAGTGAKGLKVTFLYT